MFSGIVQATARIVDIKEKKYCVTHVLQLPQELLTDLSLGASIASNGCCLTVTEINSNLVSLDLIKETLKITNLSNISIGDIVNIERAIKFNNEIGGHLMSGHIITTAEITEIINLEDNYKICMKLHDNNYMKYIMHKGFIGIEGVSLTVDKVRENDFSVHLIPETLKNTNLGIKKLNDTLNIEIDSYTQIIVNTVENILLKK
ncbi:riboflavin synthase [Candidatus Ishikawella capsulata]|uniref:Riboflavin synthase n=1 Tax=Candidatus Ishikawaella capsulata Mpkobe TaxID=476281 RepID=C5WD87_9ENTR|nr:riboflavin synthase [Candidatus Ishikawaella capsulata]BAH83293.1 riboflavin synthase subunit alpha [Candidatus Ishikawaella capsulata Mpkobe]